MVHQGFLLFILPIVFFHTADVVLGSVGWTGEGEDRNKVPGIHRIPKDQADNEQLWWNCSWILLLSCIWEIVRG